MNQGIPVGYITRRWYSNKPEGVSLDSETEPERLIREGHFYYILQDGEPVATDSEIWIKWWKEADKTIVHTDVTDSIAVSITFLGMNHNSSGKGDPILFETRILGGEHHNEWERYSTIKQAQSGHKRMVTLVEGR